MTRLEFRKFTHDGVLPSVSVSVDVKVNPMLSDTDPSFVMSVNDFVVRSSQGLPVPQQSVVSVSYNGLKASEVSDIDKRTFDGFDAAIAARREQRKFNESTKQIYKDYESKKDSSK